MHNLLHDEKDIDSIFFYAINKNINYLTLFYTANNNKYKIDYKDVNFKDTVDRIIKVYNTLKDEKNINLIGDLTKDIIKGKVDIKTNSYNKTIINTSDYDYKIMLSYIKLIIENTLNALNIDKPVSIYKDKVYLNFDFLFKDSLQEEFLDSINNVPITFYKSNSGYKLKFKIMKDNKEYIFDCDIKIFNKSIIVNIKNEEFNGEIIIDKLNINNSIVFKDSNDKVIYSNYYESDLLDSDIEKIKKVFEMINLNYEINGIKTIDNNYILYNNKENYEYYMHLNISDNLIRINLKQLKKYKKDNIDFKVEEEHYDYLITQYDNKYILIQQKYLLSNNSDYEYKKNINKSKYYLIEVISKSKLIDFEIKKIIEIKDKINSLEDIKTLTLKKDDLNGK